MLETTDWHCKKLIITSFKQISLSTSKVWWPFCPSGMCQGAKLVCNFLRDAPSSRRCLWRSHASIQEQASRKNFSILQHQAKKWIGTVQIYFWILEDVASLSWERGVPDPLPPFEDVLIEQPLNQNFPPKTSGSWVCTLLPTRKSLRCCKAGS